MAVTQHDLGKFEVYDFDKSTGIISNFRASQSFPRAYGIEFSPDGTKLYGTYDVYSTSSKLIQFNLEDNDPLANYEEIGTCSRASGLQLGINGKIYVARSGHTFLGEISNPNELGEDCSFNADAIDLVYATCKAGLPYMYYYPGYTLYNESQDQGIQMLAFPNPCKENFTVETEGDYIVKVSNAKGQIVTMMANQNGQCNIDCSKYENGIYFVNIISKGKTGTLRIVKI